jgi:hypothetical protein
MTPTSLPMTELTVKRTGNPELLVVDQFEELATFRRHHIRAGATQAAGTSRVAAETGAREVRAHCYTLAANPQPHALTCDGHD